VSPLPSRATGDRGAVFFSSFQAAFSAAQRRGFAQFPFNKIFNRY
jgi:hypothetical protein